MSVYFSLVESICIKTGECCFSVSHQTCVRSDVTHINVICHNDCTPGVKMGLQIVSICCVYILKIYFDILALYPVAS